MWVQPETDGMATLGAYLTAEEAQACLASLLAGTGNHEGGIEAARADLLVERLTGISAAEPIPVQVLLLPGGDVELAGHGPISPDHAHDLCAGITPIRLDPPPPSRGYRPAHALARYIRARDRHCQFPGCRRPARYCDLDHIQPWPTGNTSEQNLHALCRYHHRLKTHTPWTITNRTWTSPRGRKYQNDP